MKEQFDKKLADKIKASFENHEEAYDPKEWDKLASAYFAKPKGTAFPSWIYWAASFAAIALVATFLLFNQGEEPIESLSDIKTETFEEETPNAEEKEEEKDILNISPSAPIERNKNLAKSELPNQRPNQSPPKKPMPSQTLAEASSEVKLTDEKVTQIEEKLIASTSKEEEIIKEVIKETEKATPISEKTLANALKEEDESKALATINEWLSDGNEKDVREEKEDEAFEPLKLGVYLMPQTTTSSTQALNLGAGVITELSVSKRFKIDIGLAYAQQNLVPGTNNNSNVMVAESLSYSDRSAMMSSNFITTTNELSFGQLEVPFNLKYKIFENQKSDIYVISGVSNMFYLNQRNTVTYNTVNLASSGFAGSQAAITTVSETFTPDSQNNTNSNTGIGQLLNLSMGFEQNLSNGTFISIEPFYKLSLGNQTFINQQFSIGGLNLRMNFQLKDKK
ncbi:hypothetical protein [Mongoliibacter ruber]|uniref:Outer membrane protein with beta-barrel domain n=1 Tax=Mongoliibacter ruber TaxID=1750599 RepID=A0A2T0WJ70_9BACT|nr:hypothetical protein [Mongoliibacter ruber]PRY86584.1 hypothetical protein CLW00_10871 [Mongoliibacter ruber]